MSEPSWPSDSPICRIDLIRKAAASSCSDDFEWLNEKCAEVAAGRSDNRGLTASLIRDLAREHVRKLAPIGCVPEGRDLYKHRRHFHYDIIIEGLVDFPRGLYIEMELTDPDENDPIVSLLSAHPPSFI